MSKTGAIAAPPTNQIIDLTGDDDTASDSAQVQHLQHLVQLVQSLQARVTQLERRVAARRQPPMAHPVALPSAEQARAAVRARAAPGRSGANALPPLGGAPGGSAWKPQGRT